MHVIMKFRMRRQDCYKCDVPHPLPLDGKYHMFCSRENKQSRVYKIGVHFDLKNSSMFQSFKVSKFISTGNIGHWPKITNIYNILYI